MYAVKVLHGYISTNGQRTRDKDCARRFNDMRQAEMFADKIGGRVKELEMNNETRSKQEVL